MKIKITSHNMLSSLCTCHLRPINPPEGNFSAWQQPFWERISKERSAARHTLLNFELECTDTKGTHITHAKEQTHKHAVTHACVFMRITAKTFSIYERIGNWRGRSGLCKIQPLKFLNSITHVHMPTSSSYSSASNQSSQSYTLLWNDSDKILFFYYSTKAP